MDKERLFRDSLNLKQLNGFERFVLLCMAKGISAKGARRYTGCSFKKFYNTRDLLKDFVQYRTIFLRYRRQILKFMEESLTKKQFRIMKPIVIFPIRPSKYYLRYIKDYTERKGEVRSIIAITERGLKRLCKNVRKNKTSPLYIKLWLEFLIKIVFRGRLKKKEREIWGLQGRKL